MTSLASIPGFGAELGGAFYLHGEDHFRKDQTVRALIDAHLDPATRDFNYDPVRGTEIDAETLASLIATPPMMAEFRVVVLREVEGLAGSKHARDVLLQAVQNPPPGLALIMSCTVPGGSKAKMYRELAKHARSVEFREITPGDVPGWIIARAKDEHGIEVEMEAARELGGAIGSNLGVLAQEVDKLAEFIGDRGRITLEDIEAAGTSLPQQTLWKWLDLVAERNFDEAARTLPILLQGESGVRVVIQLTTLFLRLGIATERGKAGLEATLPPYQRGFAGTIARQSKQWTPAEVDRALATLLDVDRLLKASSLKTRDLHFIESWLLGLAVRAEAA